MVLSFDKVNKIITVNKPDVVVTIQDLHNKIREFEDDLVNTNIKEIVSSSGKEPLGSENYVGITLTLLNGWQLSFEERTGPETTQCYVTGGNFVGEIYPTAFTQVIIEQSSSPTLTSLSTIEYMSYSNAINYDVNSPYSGTDYPIGNREYPVNNLADAIAINDKMKFNRIVLLSDLTITETFDVSNIKFYSGIGRNLSVTLENNTITAGSSFENLFIQGVNNGKINCINCVLGAINGFEGEAKKCLIGDDIALSGQSDNYLLDCNVYVSDYSVYKVIDLNGKKLNIMRSRGNYEIRNKTSADTLFIDLVSGMLKIDSTCVAGTIVVGGDVVIEDNSDSNCNVILDAKLALQNETDNMILANS